MDTKMEAFKKELARVEGVVALMSLQALNATNKVARLKEALASGEVTPETLQAELEALSIGLCGLLRN